MQATSPETAEAVESKTSRQSPGPAVRYSPALFATICDRIANGESLRQVCRDQSMPAKSTVMRWLGEKPECRDQYARARELLTEHWADEILEIADDGATDMVEKTGRNGATYMAVDQEHIQRSRLRVDARKWLMSKLQPKKYGDRVDVEHGGAVVVEHVASLSDREKMRRFALFMLEDQAAGAIIDGETVQTGPEMADDGPQPLDDNRQ